MTTKLLDIPKTTLLIGVNKNNRNDVVSKISDQYSSGLMFHDRIPQKLPSFDHYKYNDQMLDMFGCFVEEKQIFLDNTYGEELCKGVVVFNNFENHKSHVSPSFIIELTNNYKKYNFDIYFIVDKYTKDYEPYLFEQFIVFKTENTDSLNILEDICRLTCQSTSIDYIIDKYNQLKLNEYLIFQQPCFFNGVI